MDVRVSMLGDSAWLVEWPAGATLHTRIADVHAAMWLLDESPRRPQGVCGVTGGFESLAVRYDPCAADAEVVRTWIMAELGLMRPVRRHHGKQHEIPVCYADGPDLADVARETGMPVDEVVALHSGAEYTVAMVGFAPGFPYLVGLPEALRVPRLATPRNRVEAGAVAIAGEQAGIYPCASPGGWRVLGRTGVRLFDPMRAHAVARLMPGDRVRFVPVAKLGVMDGEKTEPFSQAGIDVIDPGLVTTIQDAGRPGFEHIGVSPGGATDQEAMRVANVLLGNAVGRAVLEIAVKGPVLKFADEARVVLVGSDAAGGLRHGRAVTVAAGEVLVVGALVESMRAVLAIAGGIDIAPVMASCSTDLRAAFGGLAGRNLAAGDVLSLGAWQPERVPPTVDGVSLANPVGRDVVVRTLAGPQVDWFSDDAVERFFSEPYEVTHRQDRMGVRMHGEKLALAVARQMRSQPVATGSIQIPPDGRPMMLMAERQTHGGYPQIGCVITADVPKIARALPGTRIRFRQVMLADAHAAARKASCDLQRLRAGLSCRG